MFEDLFYDPTRIYIYTYIMMFCLYWVQFSIKFDWKCWLIPSLLLDWGRRGSHSTLLGRGGRRRPRASADVAENQMNQILEPHYRLSRNFKHHHNAFYVSLTQICLSPALNYVSLFIIDITFYESILGATELQLMIILMNLIKSFVGTCKNINRIRQKV